MDGIPKEWTIIIVFQMQSSHACIARPSALDWPCAKAFVLLYFMLLLSLAPAK